MAEFLTDSEKGRLREHGMAQDINNLGRRIKRNIEFRRENWTTYPTTSMSNVHGRIKIVLVGLGGRGKSSLGNTLVGRDCFKTGKGANSVTEKFETARFSVRDQDYLVLDTPGYMLYSSTETIGWCQQLIEEIKTLGGVHAVVFVTSSSIQRKEWKELDLIQSNLAKASISHWMIVATHSSSNYERDTVWSFISDISDSAAFGTFINDIDKRVVMVEQKSSDLQEAGIELSEKEREVTRDMVLSMVHKVIQANSFTTLEHTTLQDAVGPCFPSKASVDTPSGPKTMDKLQLNDEVLVVNRQGQTQFENVIMFSHAARDGVGRFLSISTDVGKVLSLSPGHLVHVGEVGQWKPAKDVKIGDLMFSFDVTEQEVGNLKQVKVTGISKEWFTTGIYCPHTPGGSIIVDSVLASCYTDLMSPTLAHTLMYPVRMLHRVLPEDWFVWLMPYNSEQGMPKVLWYLKTMITWL